MPLNIYLNLIPYLHTYVHVPGCSFHCEHLKKNTITPSFRYGIVWNFYMLLTNVLMGAGCMRGLKIIPSQLPVRTMSTGDSASHLPNSSLGKHLEKNLTSYLQLLFFILYFFLNDLFLVKKCKSGTALWFFLTISSRPQWICKFLCGIVLRKKIKF